jgi:hypothetical protein
MLAELKSFIVACRRFAGRGGDASRRGYARQRGSSLIEYAVLVSGVLLMCVVCIKPIRIQAVQLPICYYLNAEKVSTRDELISEGYFNEESGRCLKNPLNPMPAPYWE